MLTRRVSKIRKWVLLLSTINCLLTDAIAQTPTQLIEGSIHLPAEFSTAVTTGNRLVIKLFHPENGVQKDQTFRIYKSPKFPFVFKVGPGLDMSRRTKWRTYQLEVSTDKDGDVLTLTKDELFTQSKGLIRLGTTGLNLVLGRSK